MKHFYGCCDVGHDTPEEARACYKWLVGTTLTVRGLHGSWPVNWDQVEKALKIAEDQYGRERSDA